MKVMLLGFMVISLSAVATSISNTPYSRRVVSSPQRSHSYSIPGANVHFSVRGSPGYGGTGNSHYVKSPTLGRPFPTSGVPVAPNLVPNQNLNSVTVALPNSPPPSRASNTINGVKVMSENCRYYCRRPEGDLYCCEDSTSPINRPAVKGGRCPPSDTPCNTPSVIVPCSNDARCPGSEKCCFDPCLRRHTCTPPTIV